MKEEEDNIIIKKTSGKRSLEGRMNPLGESVTESESLTS